MTGEQFEDLSFEEKLRLLHEEANNKQKRIVLVEKGFKKKTNLSDSSDKNSSLGKPHKGHKQKRLSGEGVFYQEQKKRVSYTLTPTARSKIQQLSKHLKISESETIERFGRSWLPDAITTGEIELVENKSRDK